MGLRLMPHRDEVHKALGSPEIKPSMISAVERAFEGLEETAFEAGQKHYRDHDTQALLEKILDEMERDCGTTGIFLRPKWTAALDRVLETIRSTQDIPF